MVKKNDYPRRNFTKDGAQTGDSSNQNQNKTFQKDGEAPTHKENFVRSSRPPRENQQRENNHQKDGFHQHRNNNNNRDNQVREAGSKDFSRDNQNRGFHRDNNQNRENNREQPRQHFSRPAIKPRAEETVTDITSDIARIEKEIELELKEIRSLRLGV